MHSHIFRLGKPKAEIGTEYPDFVLCGYLPHGCFRLPRFFASGCAFAPKASFPTFTVPFLRRGFSPHSSVLCAKKRKAVFLNMPIFICKLIMNLFVHFVNIFTQKIARMEACRTVLKIGTRRAHPCSNRFCNGIFYSCSILF